MICSQFQNICSCQSLTAIEVLNWSSNQCEGKEILIFYRMELNSKNNWKT